MTEAARRNRRDGDGRGRVPDPQWFAQDSILLEERRLRNEHRFTPGSPWLYLKLYYGAGLGTEERTRTFLDEDLLGRWTAPFVRELEERGLLEEFHFVRSADPEAHLRLRLRPRGRTGLELLEQVRCHLDAEADSYAVDRWEVATYEREVDRYGGPALIAAAEQLFTADSRLALHHFAARYRDELEDEFEAPVLWPIRFIQTLLRSFWP